MEKPNNVATAKDFRELAEASAWTEAAPVTLPKSGRMVILRRPTKFYWALRRSAWPAELREKLDLVGLGEKLELSREERILFVREDAAMLNEAFVSPKFSLQPGDDQFDVRWLPNEDSEFILRYLRGQVLADGTDLETFPGSESKPTEGSGPTGPDLRPPANASAEPAGGGVADQRSSNRTPAWEPQ